MTTDEAPDQPPPFTMSACTAALISAEREAIFFHLRQLSSLFAALEPPAFGMELEGIVLMPITEALSQLEQYGTSGSGS